MSPTYNGGGLSAALAGHRNFTECLLNDISLVWFGYGIDIKFNIPWGDDGELRPDVLERPVLVTLRLLGVQRMVLVGGLTEALNAEPGRVDWGLSEVSRVVERSVPGLLGLSVQWESERRIDADL